jgi:DNA-directed RNA polymerase subunit RPC12/RpoP
MLLPPLMASRGHHINPGSGGGSNFLKSPYGGSFSDLLSNGHSTINSPGNNGSSSRRDHNIDYSALFVQLAGTFPTLYRCVSCNKTVSNRWHHANIHRPQRHSCPVCNQVFTRRDNMKAHCKVKHADQKDIFYPNLVHM